MPISSRVTLTAIQIGKEEGGLALQGRDRGRGMDLKFPVHIFPSTFFKLLKQREKNKNISKNQKRKRNKSWYEELHQATLPAHQATATEKSHFVQ